MSTSSGEAKTSDGNSANNFTPPPSSTTSSPSTQSPFDHNKPYTVTACGINSQGNFWSNRDYGPNVANPNAFHYSNANGSYYYSNPDGSTYYNNGRGSSRYTPPW